MEEGRQPEAGAGRGQFSPHNKLAAIQYWRDIKSHNVGETTGLTG